MVAEIRVRRPAGHGGGPLGRGAHIWKPSTTASSGELRALSAPPEKWRIALPGSGSHLARDTGVRGVCVHAMRPTNACSQGSALPCKCVPRAGGWHSRLWAHPERNQKQGLPDRERLEDRTCVPAIHTWDRALPQGWHRGAPGQYSPTQTECEAASQSPWTQREPGL